MTKTEREVVRYQKLNKSFLMLTSHIELSVVSLITFKKNQRKLATILFLLVSLMYQKKLYQWIYHNVQRMKNYRNVL